MKKWKNILIHHSLTKDSGTVSWSAIERYHTITLGWRDIGYHFGVENINGNYEVLVGRPLNISGAHTRGRNHDGIGICFVGNYDLIPPSNEMLRIGAKFIKGLCFALDISYENIKGHRDFSTKSCPGNLFCMDKLLDRIKVQ